METSVLVQAHTLQRRAEAHLKARRYQDSIECYKKAAEHMVEALNLTTNEKLLDSLKQQREHFLRQVQIVAIKEEQFENYKKALANRKRDSNTSNEFENAHENESTTLQVAIYKNMDMADSLLGTLLDNRGTSSDSDVANDVDVIGSKRPKDETEVIEELRTLNEQLHTLVYKLVTQLDASKQEVSLLRDRVKQLENVKAQNNNPSNNLKVITDSSGGTSPFIVSPCSELSPEVQDTSSVVAALAPLEMPSFDFASIIKSTHKIN
ncbi:nuclear receptor-binding factor 2-like [Onthophagus taurus]|uniref:nuclear receptor-binding factor 2-like n=1 Tax=Onthophagus taurus TaxID=166361 RepID=UPI000C20B84F|nr:nuclear receptor-binding factor 2-like [Onthophagus taurus]